MLCLCTRASGQGAHSNLRTVSIPLQSAYLLKDTLDIIPGSITCLCAADTLAFTFRADSILIDTSGLSERCPSLTYRWRVYPFALKKPLYRYDSLAWQRAAYTQIPIEFDFGQLDKPTGALWENFRS